MEKLDKSGMKQVQDKLLLENKIRQINSQHNSLENCYKIGKNQTDQTIQQNDLKSLENSVNFIDLVTNEYHREWKSTKNRDHAQKIREINSLVKTLICRKKYFVKSTLLQDFFIIHCFHEIFAKKVRNFHIVSVENREILSCRKFFREINQLVNSFVKTYFHEIFV